MTLRSVAERPVSSVGLVLPSFPLGQERLCASPGPIMSPQSAQKIGCRALPACRRYRSERARVQSGHGRGYRQVSRLMTSSNWVGCSTGRSAGFVPLIILSTKTATLWNFSAKFEPYNNNPPASTNSRRHGRRVRRSAFEPPHRSQFAR